MTVPETDSGDNAGRDDAVPEPLLKQSMRVLESLPDGVALVDRQGVIQWANHRLCQWCDQHEIHGLDLFDALGHQVIEGLVTSPIQLALEREEASEFTIRTTDNRYFHLNVGVFSKDVIDKTLLVITIRDVTHTILEQQKRAAIYQAGQTLDDLSPSELADMTVAERIELLKSNIIHYSRDLLQFDVLEIRLLDQQTGRLETLLSEGMQPEAEARMLYAKSENNGVTGWVAETGKSYSCRDTTKDPLYLEGCKGAKSSMTVPLVMHDQVIGTFNVETPETDGFTATDLQFLEIFSRDVAAALNTLELLVVEKATTAAESIEAIHGAVALPVDDILNDAVGVMEKYIGHD
ncbi:MAG: GAF domain-containing protein, partial [Pirellulales bacterium]